MMGLYNPEPFSEVTVMKKEEQHKILALTQQGLVHYWQGGYEEILSYFADEGTWIGAQGEQFCRGKEAIGRLLRQVAAEMVPCTLLHQEYRIVHSDRASCTVMGRYLATTCGQDGTFLQAWQRVTLVWSVQGGERKIQHCHVSNPIGELKVAKGESFVNTIGKMTWQFLRLQVKAARSRHRLVLTDGKEGVHFISPYEIEYAAADGRSIHVTLLEGESLTVRGKLSDLQERSEGVLMAIHRSYLVNPLCISSLEKQTAVLRSGARLPIPEKRYTMVREEIKEFFARMAEEKETEKMQAN